FKHYYSKLGSSKTISNNNVRAILEDNEGIIWVGTDEGLNAFDKKTETFTRYLNDKKTPNSLSHNSVWCLHQTVDGLIWIGTYGGGLNSYDKKIKLFKSYQEFDSKGNLLYENSNKVRSILEDKEGIFWIGTYGDGVEIFNPQTGKFLSHLKNNHTDNSIINDRVTSVTEDDNGVIWIGTYGGGLDQYYKKTGRFKHYTFDEKNQNSINSNQVKFVFHDKVGSVWIGTEGGGVNVYFRSSSKFNYYKKRDASKNSLLSNVVLALLEDKEGILWIGTSNGGLSSFDRETDTYTQYPDLSVANNNSILSLCEDSDGLIWVGTWGGGVVCYDKKTKRIKTFSEFKKPQYGTVVCIYQDKQGLMWIGTYGGGIFSYNKQTNQFKNYTSAHGLTSLNIYTIFQDSKNDLWIGTEGGGVNKFDKQTEKVDEVLVRDEKKNSISSNSINHIYEDRNHDLWFATTNGLNKYNRTAKRFEHFYEKDGLPNAYIYCIMADNAGNLWLTTNKGVSKFNPFVKNINGSAFRNYDVNDGLQGLEHNQGAFFKSIHTGEMFVGGVNGFNTFIPEKIADNKNIPSVKITSYKRFGEEVDLDTLIYDKKYIELSWQQNFFSFDFVALDYQMPGKNKYTFKLEGVDENWSPPSTQRYASYTELRGGDYVFKVRAANSDGIWNDEGVTLHIKINPPFWQTKWFYGLCVIIVIGGFWGFLKYRTSAIKRENKLLEEKVEERTQELAQKNKDITSSIQYAKRIQLAILPPLEQITKSFPQSFVLYKPKDIVSGDFYWFGVKDGKKIIAAVDCTGHGVPGAFMSMIGHNLLNQIISENGITEPDQILNSLHKGVQTALKQGTNIVDTSDGMDVAICSVDTKNNELKFAGAYRPLFMIKNGTFGKIEADKFPIGGSQLDIQRKFTCHTISIDKGDTFYMCSDGYADQFGGEKGKKFMVKRLNELLLGIQAQAMDEQAKTLEYSFENWKGSYQQVDDILVIGIRF
ncbi:MAG: SpoIIE family protein phosphatase, partial [Bacteroidia bacterium]|nr:SpoIIE family protein phosphatase [Bacteroidia bacterium]